MFSVPEYQPALTIFFRDGRRWRFPSARDALKQLGYPWLAANLGAFHVEHRGYATHIDGDVAVRVPVYDSFNAIARDTLGTVWTLDRFQQLESRRYHGMSRYRFWNGEGPVPGTGVFHGCSIFRSPKTTAERRLNQTVDSQEPVARPGRIGLNLPSSWDDLRRHGSVNRNWKRFRKTQYR